LTFKPKKLFLGFDRLRYLGYDIAKEGISLGDDTITALSEKPPPSSTKEAQRLLGLANWARPFLVGFSRWMAPIMEVAKPRHRWSAMSWGTAQKAAFEELKRQLARRTKLSHPTTDGPLRLFTDASCEAFGAVLTQKQGGRWVPLGFHSRKCTPAESNYSPSCLEAAAVLEGVRRWRSLLHGPARQSNEPRFEIVTDHSALTQVSLNMEKSPQLARWRAALQEFSFSITHRAGVKLAFVDYFSRSPHVDAPSDWRAADFNDTLNHATEYMLSQKEFVVAAAGQMAPIRDLAEVSVGWQDRPATTMVALVDSGAQIDLMSRCDVAEGVVLRAPGQGEPGSVEGIGQGSLKVEGTAEVSVTFAEDPKQQQFGASIRVTNSARQVDSRAKLVLSAEFLDRHGIDRLGGPRPTIAFRGRTLAHLTCASAHSGEHAAPVTRSQRAAVNQGLASMDGAADQQPARATETNALPGIAEFKTAQATDTTCQAAVLWQDKSSGAKAALDQLPKSVASWVRRHEFVHNENGLLSTIENGEARLCLPNSFRPTVLHVYHDAAGHWDHVSTARTIARSFAWPTLTRDVREYVESCALCKSRFVSTRGLHAVSGFPETPEDNFAVWHCDLAGPVRMKGDNAGDLYVLGFICRRSRMVEATIIKGKEAATTAKAFVQQIVRRYGTPVAITSDSGKEFMGQFKSTLDTMDIALHMGTPLHHTGNSIIERFWRSMWDRAALTVPEDDIDWETVVQSAAAFHNMHTPNQHTASPFETVFRQAPRSVLDAAWRPLGLPYNKDVELRVNATLQSRAERQQRRAKQRADRAADGKRPASRVAFDVGQAVWALRSIPAEDAALTTAKILCGMSPATVTKVVDGSSNRYGLTFCDNGRYVERHADHMRDRESRSALMEKWHCTPLTHDREEPGCDMVDPALNPLLPVPGKHTYTAKKGDTVVVAQEFAQVPGLDAWAVPSRPLPIVGTVISVAQGSPWATIRWIKNALGEREPDARVELRPSRCLVTFQDGSFAQHKFPKGSWALYEGRCLEKFPRLMSCIYRNGQTTFNGRPTSKWRVRGVGFGPDADILFATEERVKQLFPDDDVDAMMNRFIGQATQVRT